MGQLIVAPTYEPIIGPLIFLAGPIQGAPLWQDDAARIIHTLDDSISIANPRRGGNARYVKGDFSPEMYNEQVDWETHHLRLAGQTGVVLFWLANEADHKCYRAYAQTTRFELAEWKMRHEYLGAKLVVGIDDRFTGAKYLRRRFPQDCPDVPLCSTLQETCAQAVRLVRR